MARFGIESIHGLWDAENNHPYTGLTLLGDPCSPEVGSHKTEKKTVGSGKFPSQISEKIYNFFVSLLFSD